MMATKLKITLDELLLDQGLDHILNSPDEEFVKFVEESGDDMDELAKSYESAAMAALKAHGIKKREALKIKHTQQTIQYQRSKFLQTREDKVSLLQRLIASATALGFSISFQQRDLENFDEEALQMQIAQFQALLDDHENDQK